MRLLSAFAALLLAAGAASAVTLDLARLCTDASPVTVVGMDFQTGTLLLSLTNEQAAEMPGTPTWLVALAPGASTAALFRGDAVGRTGGSFGPGPILSGLPCGVDCLQVERWRGDRDPVSPWEPVGDPLPLGETMSFAATYDHTGTPWVLLQKLGAAGATVGWAYRLQGREWVAAGSLPTLALPSPPLSPAPTGLGGDAVVAGAARFAPSGRPSNWVTGLPTLPRERQGQLLSLVDGAAGYFAADGTLFVSADRGATWRQQVWTPWQRGSVQIWQRGSDFSTDLPGGVRGDAFYVTWFDQRDAADPRIWMSAWRPGPAMPGQEIPSPEVLWNGPGVIATDTGDRLPVQEVLQRRPGDWLLLAGCVASPGGAGLALRTVSEGAVSPAALVRLVPAWLPTSAGEEVPAEVEQHRR
jgi:hypothetical protein